MEGSKRYLESYKKIAGACRIKGYMYEVKMAGLLFLRLINEKKRFHIAFNMAAAGRFDDLVLGIDDKAVFVQLKHKLGAQISERKRLYTVRRIFAMKGYYSSYCNLKKDWGQKTDLQLWGAFSDVQFVVYTNAVVAEGEAVDTDVQNVLMTGGKCLQFSENDFPELKNEPEFNQFLHQFRFYTQQASEKQLDSLIRNELLRALGMDSQFHTFLANIAKWMEGPGSYLTENVEFWTNIVKCNVDYLNKAKIDQLAKFNLQFDDRELNLFRQQLPEGGGLLSVQNSTSMEAGYKKTDGACRMEGCEYDVKMAGLLFLRLSNERKSFHIASNMDATGEFDDLVLIIDGKAAFVQLKHKLGAQVSERKRTYTVRRIFRIEKLYSSYYNLRYVWGQKTDLQLWGPFSDVQFIVYTNAVVAVGEAVDTDVQNVLITGGKCLRFSENDFPELRNEPEFNQFLLQFRFYTEQASEKKLDSLIRNELIRALGTDSQFQTFLTNITSWMEGPGSYLTENVEFWKDIVKCSVDDLCRGKIDQLSNFDLQFDERELNLFRQQLPEGGGLLRVHNSNALTCLKVHQSVDKKILVDANVLEDKMSEVLTLWGRWPGCDVLAIDGWVEANEKIVHNLGSGKTLVVIDDSENGRELECLSHKDEFRFGQLNEESKRQVLDCKINFQGESIKLNTLVDNTVFNKVANAQIVTQLVSGIAESIGDKLTQQSEHYIPRKFVTRQHVSETIFSDDRDCLVVNGVSLQALRQIVLATKVVEIFDETKHSEEGVCRCYVIGGKEDFEKAKNIFERVHWLHKEQTGFIWKQSKGGVSYIKAHLMDVTSIRSLQEVMLLSDKVKLLVAQPGMGKSTEVVNLAQEFKRRDPACWVVTVVLREHTEYLNKCGDSALELLLRAGKFMSDFAKSLFKHELGHGGNIVILIDGFDEIIPHYTGKVLHMLRQLIIHCKFKQLWITSRSFMKEMLEESFSCLSFELQPFTKQDQRDFLAKLWNDMSDGPYNLDIFIASVLEVTGNSLNDKLGQFTEIPLQTRMLAEVFRSEASHFCQSGEMNIDRKLDLLELYDRFVDRKWNIFVCEKGRVDVINLVQHRILRLQEEEYENDHMACAVHSLLKTEDFNRLQSSKDIIRRVERFQDRFRNGEEKSGIVAQIVNSKAMFIHKTFLDFFAAKWFTKNFKLEREYLKEILFREEFVIVREFFDRILAEGFELHTAILNEDKDYVLKLLSSPECDVNGKDKGGRTPLHLAVINHTESSNFSPNKTVCEIIELLLQNHCDCNVEDEVFHWRPLTLADKIQAWSAVDMLLGSQAESSDMIFTMELIKGEEGDQFLCRLLNIVALQGYVNIAKLMFKCGLCVNHPLEAHFNMNIYPNAITATMLHIASSAGQTKLVEFFLDAEETEGFIKKRTLVWDDNQHHLDTEKTSVYTTTKERLEIRDSDHRTPLFWAAVKGRLETVKMLVSKGANVNTDDAWKQTPLYYAISGCHAEVVKFLIENGANVKVCDEDGDSITFTAFLSDNLHILRQLLNEGGDVNACNKYGESLIYTAVERGNVDFVRLLMDKDADINASNIYGESPVFAAIEGGNVHIVRLLMDKGANVNEWNIYGESPIFVAVVGGSVDIVRLLMDKGADVNARNETGDTPILAAAKGGSVDVVRLLMDKGADVNVRNETGDTPILAAAKGGSVDVVRFLMDKGADVNVRNETGDTPILAAAKGGSVDVVRLLMDKGADVNVRNETGDTPILAAAKGGSVDVVRLLMDKGADNVCNQTGDTPILAAAKGGSVDVVRLLMDKGADVNLRNQTGDTPILATAKGGSVDVVRLLMDKGADVNVRNQTGDTPILAAAKGGSVDVVRLLMDKDADINASNIYGKSPVFAAIEGGNVHIVRLLMDKGANVNECNIYGESPIFVAVVGGSVDIVRLLMDKGADVNARNETGNTPILAAANGGSVDVVRLLMDKGADVNVRNEIGDIPILAAAKGGSVDVVRFLMDKGADVNVRNETGDTPILAAAKGGSVDVVRLLLDKGADVNVRNETGDTPILAAAKGGSVDVVRLLMDKGADVNVRNQTGDTPILAAAKGGSVDVVRLLMDKGADVNVRNETGDTPILAAAKGGSVDVVRLLMDKGADVNVRNQTGDTPILAAAKGGSVDIVRLLMDKGADVDVCDYTGDTPILAAAKGGSVDIVRLLMDKGTDVNVCIETGDTPILAAAKGGSVDIVRLLMDKGADVNVRNQTGDTPILAAAKGGSVDVVKLLMDKGADVNALNKSGECPIFTAV
ncbi:uncharacterized protein [Periplaneta americana]|uniref:uncharacterized protein n=1 Tax=Periplaneta americana TaxID=6978 RepID=UPI0037E8FDB0